MTSNIVVDSLQFAPVANSDSLIFRYLPPAGRLRTLALTTLLEPAVCASAEPSTTAAIGLFESGGTSYMTAPLAESSQLDQ